MTTPTKNVYLELLKKDGKVDTTTIDKFLQESNHEVPILPYDSYNAPKSIEVLQDTVIHNYLISILDSGEVPVAYLKATQPAITPDPSDESREARLFAALQLTKMNALASVKSFQDLATLKLVKAGKIGSVDIAEMKTWAGKLLLHPRGKKILSQLITDMLLLKSDQTTLDNISQAVKKVEFFTCEDKLLWSFAGAGTIYLNLSAFQTGVDSLAKYKNPQTDKKVVLLAIAAAGWHAIAHLSYRKATNDLNAPGMDVSGGPLEWLSTQDVGTAAQILVFAPIRGIPRWFVLHDAETLEELYAYVDHGTKKLHYRANRIPQVHCPSIQPGLFKIFPPLPLR